MKHPCAGIRLVQEGIRVRIDIDRSRRPDSEQSKGPSLKDVQMKRQLLVIHAGRGPRAYRRVAAILFGPSLLVALGTLPAVAGSSLDLGFADTGISFGNSARWRGVRFNAIDEDIESIIGVNITFWKPDYNDRGAIMGIAAGLYGVGTEEFRGIGASLISHRVSRTRGIAVAIATVGDVKGDYDDWSGASEIRGVAAAIGGIGAGDVYGVAVAGLGIGAHDGRGIFVAGLGAGMNEFSGIMAAGLGLGVNSATGIVVAGLGMGADRIRGVAVAGLGMGTSDFSGIGIAGLGMGAHDVEGVFVAGLGIGAHDVSGATAAGLGIGAHDVTGITIAGLGVGARDVRGITVTGIGIGAEYVQGIAVTGIRFLTDDLSGISVGAWNHSRNFAQGLQIGLLNMADDLQGVQIGLLNYAGNKRGIFRWLPLLNMSR